MKLSDSLKPQSCLKSKVQDGIQALKNGDKSIVNEVKTSLTESLNLDEAMLKKVPSGNRWDYLLTYCDYIIALEPHPATQSEVKVILKKKETSETFLKEHLAGKNYVSRWFWAASGKSAFQASGKEARLLSQKGIMFIGRQLRKRDL